MPASLLKVYTCTVQYCIINNLYILKNFPNNVYWCVHVCIWMSVCGEDACTIL